MARLWLASMARAMAPLVRRAAAQVEGAAAQTVTECKERQFT